MKLSDSALEKLKALEGFCAHVYFDVAGNPTIGYGHLLTDTDTTLTLTKEEACLLLRTDVLDAEQCVNEQVSVPLTQAQFDALVLFVYNVGKGAFADSTLRKKLNNGDYASVPAQLERWTNAGGERIGGLVRRRNSEIAMWNGEVANA